MGDTFIVVSGTVASVLTVAGACWAAVKWYHKALVKAVSDGVAAQLQPVRRELAPNGGSSVKDVVDEIRNELKEHRVSTRESFLEVHRRIDRILEDHPRGR